MKGYITYWSNAGDDSFTLEIRLEKSGNAHLSRPSNVSQSDQPVGMFEMQMPASDTEILWSLAESEEFKKLNIPSGVEPGEIIRKITYRNSGQANQEVVKFAAESTPAEKLFLEMEKGIGQLIKRVSGEPVIGMLMRLDSVKEFAQDPKKVQLTVELKSTGKNTLEIAHPNVWKEQGTLLETVFSRNDVKLAEMRNHHRISKMFSSTDLLATVPKVPDSHSVVINPGQQVAISFLVEKPDSPGSYDIFLMLETEIIGPDNLIFKCLVASSSVHMEFRE